MNYLLDTNIIVNHLRKKKMINSLWFKTKCAISVITYGELCYGASKSSNPNKTMDAVKYLLYESGMRIAQLNSDIMKRYGRIKADLEEKGQKLDEFDLLIGATAIVDNYTLVTENKKHFERIEGISIL